MINSGGGMSGSASPSTAVWSDRAVTNELWRGLRDRLACGIILRQRRSEARPARAVRLHPRGPSSRALPRRLCRSRSAAAAYVGRCSAAIGSMRILIVPPQTGSPPQAFDPVNLKSNSIGRRDSIATSACRCASDSSSPPADRTPNRTGCIDNRLRSRLPRRGAEPPQDDRQGKRPSHVDEIDHGLANLTLKPVVRHGTSLGSNFTWRPLRARRQFARSARDR